MVRDRFSLLRCKGEASNRQIRSTDHGKIVRRIKPARFGRVCDVKRMILSLFEFTRQLRRRPGKSDALCGAFTIASSSL